MTDAPCGKMGPAAIVKHPPSQPRSRTAPADCIERVLFISTGHLTGATMAALDKPGGDWSCFPLEYGFLAYVPDERIDDMPDDLWACLEFAKASGCTYVRFDCDATLLNALPDHSATH